MLIEFISVVVAPSTIDNNGARPFSGSKIFVESAPVPFGAT